jgi:adenylate kinase
MPGKTKASPFLRRFCFTGVRGVGKSTIINRIRSSVPDIKFVSGSDILQNMIGEGYRNFEYLPEEEKYLLRIKLNETLCEIQQQTGMDLVVDAHLTVYNLKTKFIDTIFTLNDINFYTDIILLDSSPENVYCHRIQDTMKKRICDFEIIKKEVETERREAIRMSNEHTMDLHIFQMDEEVVVKIIRFLNSS